MRTQLIPVDGGPPLDLPREMTLVGRKEDCDLRLDHKSVSKQHCVLLRTDGLLLVRDLGSTNGTRVNGQRVRRAASQRAALLANDQLNIASLRYRVHIGPGEAAPPPGEHTMQMDAADVAAILSQKAKDESSGELPVVPVKANQLPDVYKDDRPPKP